MAMGLPVAGTRPPIVPLAKGESAGALWSPSVNFGARRGCDAPSLIVLHYTAMTCAGAACRVLSDPSREVSAHYLIGRDGFLWQLVRETDRAWHAGAGSWRGEGDVNSRSIGIELCNDGIAPFAEPQMARLERLLREIMMRWTIRPHAVLAHSDTAPGRKIDPGARFDWQRLARQGLALWPDPATPGDFWQDAASYGYDTGGDRTALLRSFRLRFRPWASGPMDDTDRAIMASIARQARKSYLEFTQYGL